MSTADWKSSNMWMIDNRRKTERTNDDKSFEHWNWIFNEADGFWYPKMSPFQCTKELDRLKNLDEFCVEDPFELLKLDVVHTCNLCGFVGNTKNVVINHRNNRGCRIRKARNDAVKLGQTFQLESEKQVACGYCNESFTTKYSYARHCKTPAHQKNITQTVQPTKCPCGKTFPERLPFVKHMKKSEKCRGMCSKCPTKHEKWLLNHRNLRCTFPVIQLQRIQIV